MPSVVTANRLVDGIVVYLAPDGSWTEQIDRARIAETEDEVKALEEQAAADVKARKVVAVYAMDVAVNGGTVDPLSVREKIRAAHRTTLTKDWYDVPL
ncbi:MAG TPA: DUF2849 domain-containing protein [Methyloceanibacter sp.]|nr:DUF2849 domain-containing protein [Methyloceanibacter sp.]